MYLIVSIPDLCNLITLLSKFTRLFINAVVYMVLYGFLSNNIYCLQMFDFDGQDDQATYDLSPSW